MDHLVKVWPSLEELRKSQGRFACCRYCQRFSGTWCSALGQPQIPDGVCLAWEEAVDDSKYDGR